MLECKDRIKLANIVDACKQKMREQLTNFESFHLEILYGQFLLDARRVQAMHAGVCATCARVAKEAADKEKQSDAAGAVFHG